MSKVITALSVSVDGYITGRDPGVGRGLGDGSMLFDWYFDGDTASRVTSGIEDAVAVAQKLAEGKDIALMGGGVVSAVVR